MKNWKRFTALGLTAVMLCGMLAGCGDSKNGDSGKTQQATEKQSTEQQSGQQTEATTEVVNELEWLNSSQTLPLVKEGTEKTLSIYVNMPTDSPEPEDTWFYQFIENAMNINLEVTKFTDDNKSEFMSLTMASGELPDMIIGSGFGASSLVKYGQIEGQLMDMAPYLNETYMPNLTAIYEESPGLKSAIQDSEGHVWSFGNIADGAECQRIKRIFINYSWLEECGLETPETLDEFLNAMRTFKQKYEDCYPIGGNYTNHSPIDYILNAFGYLIVGGNSNGMQIAMRNGEVVLPVADREAYGDFLAFMKTCYDEGLLHPDFFTMDKSTTEAIMASGQNGLFDQAPFLYTQDFRQWWGAMPLTSEYNETAQWPFNSGAVSAGGIVVTSACEEPELAATFIDWFYTYGTYRTSTIGPNADHESEYLYGFDGWIFDEETMNTVQLATLKEDFSYPTTNAYVNTVKMWNYSVFGKSGYDENAKYEVDPLWWFPDTSQLENPADIRYDEEVITSGQGHYMYSLHSTVGQHVTTEVYPATVYLDAEQTERSSNLMVAIKEYATQEMSKFITGSRSLDELDDYFDEIERLGAKEYVQIYKDYYESIQ